MTQVAASSFVGEDFDAVKWVDALDVHVGVDTEKNKDIDDDVDGADEVSRERRARAEAVLAENEVRLQLMAEELAARLEGVTEQSAAKLPACMSELHEAARQARTLRERLLGMVSGLTDVRERSADTVAAVARVHARRQRLEEARAMMQEAAGLADLMRGIEDIFDKGDIVRSAEALCALRRGIAVVGNELPEFAGGEAQLAALEKRLKLEASPAVGGAIRKHSSAEVGNLMAALTAVGHPELVGDIYIEETRKLLTAPWKATVVRPALSGGAFDMEVLLGKFYDDVVSALEKENRWLAGTLPDERLALLIAVVDGLEIVVKDDFAACVDAAVKQTDGASGVERLMALHSLATSFARGSIAAIRGADEAATASIVKSIFSPYEAYGVRYAELERAELAQRFASFGVTGSEKDDLQAIAERVEESLGGIVAAVESAMSRCTRFTGAVAFESVLTVINDVVCDFVAMLHTPLKASVSRLSIASSSASRAGSNGTNSRQMGALDEAFVQGAVAMLNTATRMCSRLKVLDVSVRVSVLSAVTELVQGAEAALASSSTSASASSPALLSAMLRLASEPARLERIRHMRTQFTKTDFAPLQQCIQRVRVFTSAAENLLEGVILQPARAATHQLADARVWSEREAEATSAGYTLPTFSAYPQEAVTSLGEYLLTVPTILEPLAENEDSADADSSVPSVSDAWISRIAESASQLYWSEMGSLTVLSSRGARQAVADLDYLINVLLALSAKPPLQLRTYASVLRKHCGEDNTDPDGTSLHASDNDFDDDDEDPATVALARRQLGLS